MSWQSARDSAVQLAERLKLFEKPRAIERRSTPRPEAETGPEPYYVKPSRKAEPEPQPVSVADSVTAELDDLVEAALPTPAPVYGSQDEPARESSEDVRRAPRKAHILPAYVTAPDMANVVPARVIDMSATGAKIELTPMGRATGIPMTHMPDRFVLVLRHDKLEVDCEIVWREEWIIGVRFLGFPRPSQRR